MTGPTPRGALEAITRRLIEMYRRFEQRNARLQRSMAKLGVGAFLSGHEGWHYHRGLRETEDRHD